MKILTKDESGATVQLDEAELRLLVAVLNETLFGAFHSEWDLAVGHPRDKAEALLAAVSSLLD
jgi:hypothetical protein